MRTNKFVWVLGVFVLFLCVRINFVGGERWGAIQLAAEHGLILLACGYYGNVLRFLPPLTMPDTIVAEALDKFEVLFRAATEN